MGKIVVHWIAAFLAVLAAAHLLRGYVSYNDFGGVAIFAGVLALLNIFVKPVLGLVTAPLSCLTLGLFVWVINAFLFWLASQLTGGSAVRVEGVIGALLGALIVSLASMIVGRLVGK